MEYVMSRTEMAVQDEVEKARVAIMDVAKEHPDTLWRPFDLRAAAMNGGDHGGLGLALDDLIEEGALVQHDDGRIGLPKKT